MKNAVILHGGPSKEEYYDPDAPSMSNAHWIPWLQAQFLKHDIPSATPEVPHSYIRDWKMWKGEVERHDIGPETILVAHSTGAGFFVKYLSVNKNLHVGRVVFVAPFMDPERRVNLGFFHDYKLDGDMSIRTKGMTIFNSDDDDKDIQQSVAFLRKNIAGIGYREFHNYGHFCYGNLKTDKFPELLEEALK